MNSVNAPLGRLLLSFGNGLFEGQRSNDEVLLMYDPGIFVAPKVGDSALWLIVKIPSVDDQGWEHGRKDIEVADL